HGKDLQQPGRVFHWDGMKEDRVDHGEYSGVGPNAQRQREYRDDGKYRRLAQAAQRILDVLGNVVHADLLPSSANRLPLDLLRDALGSTLVSRRRDARRKMSVGPQRCP